MLAPELKNKFPSFRNSQADCICSAAEALVVLREPAQPAVEQGLAVQHVERHPGAWLVAVRLRHP